MRRTSRLLRAAPADVTESPVEIKGFAKISLNHRDFLSPSYCLPTPEIAPPVVRVAWKHSNH